MQKFECKNCGAELKWSPTAGALECEYCGEQYQPSDFEDATTNADNADVSQHIVDKTYATTSTTEDEIIYKCDECGAEIVALQTTMATECPYCGRPISLTHAHKGNFRPELVLPFKITKETAINKVKQFISRAYFAPKEFKQAKISEQLKGLFVPFYLHNFHVALDETYECDDQSHSRRGDDRITTHKIYNVRVQSDTQFDKVPVDGSTVIDDKIMNVLEPFNFDNLQDYNPAYMAGYYADQPDETVESTRERAFSRGTTVMREQVHELLKKYASRERKQNNIKISDHSAQYAMLPIWRLNVSYKNEVYQFDVNGQTGEVSGKVPLSIPKVAIVSGAAGLVGFLYKFLPMVL